MGVGCVFIRAAAVVTLRINYSLALLLLAAVVGILNNRGKGKKERCDQSNADLGKEG